MATGRQKLYWDNTGDAERGFRLDLLVPSCGSIRVRWFGPLACESTIESTELVHSWITLFRTGIGVLMYSTKNVTD